MIKVSLPLPNVKLFPPTAEEPLVSVVSPSPPTKVVSAAKLAWNVPIKSVVSIFVVVTVALAEPERMKLPAPETVTSPSKLVDTVFEPTDAIVNDS